jgi:hypothetical protein
MKAILKEVIELHKAPQVEGLMEFLYAISIQKLTLKKEHLFELSTKLDSINDNELVNPSIFTSSQLSSTTSQLCMSKLKCRKKISRAKIENGNVGFPIIRPVSFRVNT